MTTPKKDVPSRWLYDHFSPHEVHMHAIKGTLYHSHSGIQEIVVAESVNFGRCLTLDNEFQSAELDEFIYHEAMVHPAMTLHPHPEDVAIIGGGEGAVLREVLRHKGLSKAVMVEIDRAVVDCIRQYMPGIPGGAFSDPRAEFCYQDGRKFIEETKKRFDVIFVDVTCPMEGGPSYRLFTQEFYCLVKERLNPEGILSVQADTTSPVALNTYTITANTLARVFPGVFPYAAFVPSYAMLWGFCLATRGLDPRGLTKEEVDKRLNQRVPGELRFYDGITHQALFNLPKYIRVALNRQTRVNMDSAPIIEKFPGFREK